MLDLYMKEGALEVGVDEVGRGCLAGPVVAAAVVWPIEKAGILDHKIRDSKKVPAVQRKILAAYIKDNALDWSVSFVDNCVIDDVNILNATYMAMHSALDGMAVPFDHILVDGNRFKVYKDIPHTCVVKGDATYISIAAASILAKEARDKYMVGLAKEEKYKGYGWEKNVGYGTPDHLEAMKALGLSDMHRVSFKVKGI